MKTWFRTLAASLVLVATPAVAQAQSWWVAPFVGVNAGADATKSRPAVGVAGGWMSTGWLGAEADVSWAPTFFEQDGFLIERQVLTAMWNGVVALPLGGESVKPFVSGGLGLFRPKIAEAGGLLGVDENKLGWNLGGGAMFMRGNVGARGDVRYFRGITESDMDTNAFDLDFSKFGFWRVSAGLVVRF